MDSRYFNGLIIMVIYCLQNIYKNISCITCFPNSGTTRKEGSQEGDQKGHGLPIRQEIPGTEAQGPGQDGENQENSQRACHARRRLSEDLQKAKEEILIWRILLFFK